MYLARFPFTTDNLVFRLYNTISGLPNAQLGTDLTLPPSAVSTTAADFESFDVSAFNVNVNVGDVLAFSIISTGSTSYILPFSETQLYAGGQPVRRVMNAPPDPWQPNPGVVRDYGFRTYGRRRPRADSPRPAARRRRACPVAAACFAPLSDDP